MIFLTNTSILAILAVGMMMVLVSGGLDLSVGSILALSGMVVAQTVFYYPNTNPIIAFALGIFVGVLCGVLNGGIIIFGNVLPIITTLGTLSVYRGITFIVSKGGWISAHEMPDSFKQIATSRVLGVNSLVFITIFILIVFYFFLFHTRTGRKVYAIGNNKRISEDKWDNVKQTTFMVYVIIGGLAGLAGTMWVSKFASAQGNTAMGYEFKVISACVLGGVSIAGGRGKMFSLLMGIFIIGVLDNALPLVRISPFWQYFIQGIVILSAVIINVLIERNVDLKVRKRRGL